MESAQRYGQGAGYKRDIAAMWRDWFENTEAAAETAKVTGERLQDAWTSSVMEPLIQAMQRDPEHERG